MGWREMSGRGRKGTGLVAASETWRDGGNSSVRRGSLRAAGEAASVVVSCRSEAFW